MAKGNSSKESNQPLSAAKEIDAVCDRFEEAWIAGQQPQIEDYLGSSQGPQRSALFRELLRVELHYRIRAGERPAAEEYRQR